MKIFKTRDRTGLHFKRVFQCVISLFLDIIKSPIMAMVGKKSKALILAAFSVSSEYFLLENTNEQSGKRGNIYSQLNSSLNKN